MGPPFKTWVMLSLLVVLDVDALVFLLLFFFFFFFK